MADQKWTAANVYAVSGVSNGGPLIVDGKPDLHPLPILWERGPDGEFSIGNGISQTSESFEIEEDLPGIEVGILVAEEGKIPFVGLGCNGDVPPVVPIVILKVVQGQL